MTANEFELVTEMQPDALNLVLAQSSQGQIGTVHIPTSSLNGRLDRAVDSGELPAMDAFRAAIKLANEMKLPIVVMDPDDVWDKTWGLLFVAE